MTCAELPMTVRDAIQSIQQHLDHGQYTQAIALCQHNLAIFPGHDVLYRLWGKGLDRLGKPEEAIAIYQQGLQHTSDSAALHAELGRLYGQQQHLALAITYYQKALQINPTWGDVHHNLGAILHQTRQWDAAAAAYQKALNHSQHPARVHMNIGRLWSDQQRNSLAIAHYQQALHHDPSHLNAYHRIGQFLVTQKAFEQAIELYQQALIHCDAQKDKASIHNRLGQIYQQQNQLSDALTAYETAVALDPELAIAHYNMGHLWSNHQHYPNAHRCFQKALDCKMNHAALSSSWGFLLLEQGDWSTALTLFKTSVQLQSAFIQAYCEQALGRTADNTFNRVRMACAQLLQGLLKDDDDEVLIPFLGQVYEAIADLFYEAKIFKRAEPALQKALWLNTHNIDLYVKLGHCFAQQNRLDAAIAIYQSGLMQYQLDTSGDGEASPLENRSHDLQAYAPQAHVPQAHVPQPHALQTHPAQTAPSNQYAYRAELQTSLNKVLQAKQKHLPQIQPSDVLQGLYPNTWSWSQQYQSRTIGPLYQSIEWGTSCAGNASDRQPPQGLTDCPPLPLVPTATRDDSCGGVTCSGCMTHLIDSFHSTQVCANVYVCGTQDQATVPPPYPTFVATIPQGRAWISPHQNSWLVCDEMAVITPDRYILGDVSRCYPWYLPGCKSPPTGHHSFVERYELPAPQMFNGNVAILSSLSGNVYYHWMIDVLPRLGLLKKSMALDRIDHFVVNSLTHNFQRETLTALGIPLEKVVESDRVPHIKAHQLIVPSFPGHLDWVSEGSIDFLRQTFLPTELQSKELSTERSICNLSSEPSEWPQRIYISRADARYRTVLNEAEVVETLGTFDVTVVTLEDLSVADQALLFANAQLIVSPHGSSLTNLVFCQPGATVLELFSANYLRTDYWMISQALKLRHYHMAFQDFGCYPLRRLMYQTPLTEDIYVDIKTLKSALNHAVESLNG